ncbi:thioredoxin-like protein [Scheffersomyces amazonensis]|uniref:thioredoxin-like protein n=1 Tax=Scheffersomyces amazonensis TaxID=1078765 RepID=UPI00315C9F08
MIKWTHLLLVIQLVAVIVARATEDEYKDDPNIFELTPSNFDKVIHKTNYTSIVKFYAPWCGYCQQLKPVYKKLGKFLHEDSQYDVNVAAVNCDKEYNKPLCSQYQVQGFPTVMVFRPPKYVSGNEVKNTRAASEIYNGERNLKAMVSFVTSRLKNYTKRFHNINSESLKAWLGRDVNSGFSKVLLLTSNSQVSPLFKSLAIDFLSSVKFGTVTIKNVKDIPNHIEIDGKEVELSTDVENISLPLLLYYDDSTSTFKRYSQNGKLNNKKKISQWIVDETNSQPVEGPLSKKEKKYYSNYRSGKKVKKQVPHDEL